jgi:uncharacterized membrane protein YtjA (UPF0391 family)
MSHGDRQRLFLSSFHRCDALSRTTQERRADSPAKEDAMLIYAAVFFLTALVSALFGFTGIADGAVSVGRHLFVLFSVLALMLFLIGLADGI